AVVAGAPFALPRRVRRLAEGATKGRMRGGGVEGLDRVLEGGGGAGDVGGEVVVAAGAEHVAGAGEGGLALVLDVAGDAVAAAGGLAVLEGDEGGLFVGVDAGLVALEAGVVGDGLAETA